MGGGGARGSMLERLTDIVRAARWRVAARLGRALVGGRLAELDGSAARLEQRLASATTELDAVRIAARARDARLAALVADLATLAARLDGLTTASEDARRTVARDLAVANTKADALRDQATRIAERLDRHGRSIRWLAEHEPSRPSAADIGPLVSIVMAVWNRAGLVGAAIDSVVAQTYRHWELLVVDDGSDDDTPAVVGRRLHDGRIRYMRLPHRGETRARNRALAESRGEVVAYLDSDNTWRPEYLAAVVSALAAAPEHDTAYAAELVDDRRSDDWFVRGEPFDAARLRAGNYIDLNVFAHRRALFERLGGFDEHLTRLTDWDLILRYTAARAPLVVDVLGGRYTLGLPDQVSERRSLAANHYRVQRKLAPSVPAPVRVLYALWHYPQLSESYVRAEIAGVRRRGVEVEVWAETEGCAPFPADVPVHRDGLDDAIARFAPDVVHAHWLGYGLTRLGEVARAGLPLTLRGHGFEFDPDVVRRLAAHPTVHGIYLFPHFAAQVADAGPKVCAMPACFDPDRYPPAARKDPRLVVRVAAGLPTKALDDLFAVARACPRHRVVLAVARANHHEAFVDALAEENRRLGSPVELRVDLDHDAVGRLVGEAGIYLHTHGLLEPYGMPLSIAEAMATGCHVIARRCTAAETYVGDGGRCYDTAAEAATLVTETLSWDDERWHRARLAAVDSAYRRFTDLAVLPPLVDAWVAVAQRLKNRSLSAAMRAR